MFNNTLSMVVGPGRPIQDVDDFDGCLGYEKYNAQN